MKRYPFLQYLVLFAFLARGIIPAGFMPGQGSGEHSLVICSASGLTTIHVPADKLPPSQGHEHQCPYAAGLAQVTPPVMPVLPFIQVISEQRVALAEIFTPLFKTKSYLSQGPPFSLT